MTALKTDDEIFVAFHFGNAPKSAWHTREVAEQVSSRDYFEGQVVSYTRTDLFKEVVSELAAVRQSMKELSETYRNGTGTAMHVAMCALAVVVERSDWRKPDDEPNYVSVKRDEYEALRAELEALRAAVEVTGIATDGHGGESWCNSSTCDGLYWKLGTPEVHHSDCPVAKAAALRR